MFRATHDNDDRFAIELVDECLKSAAQINASDVHFNPSPERWSIWFRVDGVLVPHRDVPRSTQTDPVMRLMAMAGLPTYRSGTPQEAMLRWMDPEPPSEMRLAVFPTVHGTRAVVRRMETSGHGELGKLGFETKIAERLRRWCHRADGLILFVGPAGSGKTTALYGCLRSIALANDRSLHRRSVLTIEDPVESTIPGVNQSQVDSSAMSLATALRAAVRQDADVLLVSEIRDAATAAAVVDASMLGHLAFSSMHAGGIGAALSRLHQMDIPIHAIESSLLGICNVRLLRRRCGCDVSDCQRCYGSGYHGRFPIASMLDLETAPGSAAIEALRRHGSATQIDRAAHDAGLTLLADAGRDAIDEGKTDAAELARVLGECKPGGNPPVSNSHPVAL